MEDFMRYEPEHCEFDFYFLEKHNITHGQIKKFSDYIYQEFLRQCKNSNGELFMTAQINSEWILRTYSATKMTMASTLLLNSAEYALEKNNKIVVPYLLYYAIFSACRALLYVLPTNKSSTIENLMNVTHQKVINIIPDEIKSHLDKDTSKKLSDLLYDLRGERELFSYKFPASGLREDLKLDETIDMCGIVVELAELASRQIQKVFENKIIYKVDKDNKWSVFDMSVIEELYTYSTKQPKNFDSISWIDNEDWYRVDYIKRKVKFPVSILFTMTEGMTEDFFGAWYCDECNENAELFNPDHNWSRIFPIP